MRKSFSILTKWLSRMTQVARLVRRQEEGKQLKGKNYMEPSMTSPDTQVVAGAEAIEGYEKYTKDTLLVGIANLVLSLRGLILLPILTKTLGAELYGIWAQILITLGLLAPLASLQLDQAMTRFLTAKEDKGEIGRGLSSILVVISLSATILSLLMFVIAGVLATTVFGGSNAEPFIKMAAPVLFVTIIAERFIRQYFRAFRQMKKYSSFMILQTIAEVSLISYLVLAGFGLPGIIYALLAARLLMLIIGALLIIPRIKIAMPSFSLIKTYLVFSLPLIPFMLSAWIVGSSDRYVIGYFMNIDAVGLYSVAYNLGNIVHLFITPIWIVLLPAITSLYENNKIHELKTHLRYSLKFFLTFAIPAFVGLSVLSKSLLGVLTTSEFVEGYFIIPIIALAIVLFGSSTIMGNILMLVKRTKTLALVYGGSALLNIVLNIALVPVIGILGAALATLTTFTVHLIVMSKIGFRELPFDIDLKFIIRSIISSLIMGAVVFSLNPDGIIGIIVAIIAGAAVYSGMLILLKGVTKQEYAFLKGIIKK
ncbi:lipid II flippase MurJ [subsurface metagenome]